MNPIVPIILLTQNSDLNEDVNLVEIIFGTLGGLSILILLLMSFALVAYACLKIVEKLTPDEWSAESRAAVVFLLVAVILGGISAVGFYFLG